MVADIKTCIANTDMSAIGQYQLIIQTNQYISQALIYMPIKVVNEDECLFSSVAVSMGMWISDQFQERLWFAGSTFCCLSCCVRLKLISVSVQVVLTTALVCSTQMCPVDFAFVLWVNWNINGTTNQGTGVASFLTVSRGERCSCIEKFYFYRFLDTDFGFLHLTH